MPSPKSTRNCFPKVVWVNGDQRRLTVITTGSHKPQEKLKCRCDVEITLMHVTDIHGLTTERTWEATITDVAYKGRIAPKEKKPNAQKRSRKAKIKAKTRNRGHVRPKPKKRSRVAAKPTRRAKKK